MGKIYYSANEAPSTGCFNGIIVHDLLTIAAQQSPQGGLVAKGTMVLNMGYKYPTGENGEYFYLQNPVGAPIKQVFNCLFGPSYGVIVQVGAGSTGQGEIEFRYCSVYGGGREFWLRGWSQWARIRCQDTVIIKAHIPLGHPQQSNGPNGIGQFLDNYTIDSYLAAHGWKTLEVTGNTVVATADVEYVASYATPADPVDTDAEPTWNNNTYYNSGNKLFVITDKCGRRNLTFDEWQDEGLDASSMMHPSMMHPAPLPTKNVIFVRPISGVDGVKGTIDVLAWQVPTPSSLSVPVAELSLTSGVQYCLRSRDNPTDAEPSPTGPNNNQTFPIFDFSEYSWTFPANTP